MGLMKFLARKGAIGGTARAVAKQYKYFRTFHPDTGEFDNEEIFKMIIKARYQFPPNKIKEEALTAKTWSMNGLKDLVVGILTIEAGYADNSFEIQSMFEEIIEEELLKQNISPQDI